MDEMIDKLQDAKNIVSQAISDLEAKEIESGLLYDSLVEAETQLGKAIRQVKRERTQAPLNIR